ncbi:MAG TPA: DUF456 domain-containing protein [Thermodesulfobacteriota bacterium]|nr:DUF456 domain-containing protein [Thermodesulfobacteriota bacterium]
MLLGIAGCVLPILPGPVLSFLGLLLLALLKQFSPPLTPTLIIIMAILTVVVTIGDYLIPLWGAKRYGATKWGIWGSVIGMAIGIFFSPFGMLLGAFIGAVTVEWLVQKERGKALKAGWGVFIGSLAGTALKLGVSGMMAYYFIRGLW